MSLVNTKSMLAKLLASENITVEHGNYETASMDVKNRVLRLPIWKEMSGSLYDLMVLHEVGHALYTPEDGWHESASDKGHGYKSFLNVVEDARIERKIKDKYPGGRRAFVDGYLDLINKDFFGVKNLDVNDLGLIDRINLHFKGGFIHDIEFSAEESEFVEKVSKTMTWDDVVRVTDELYAYAKENESETDMSDHSSMSWSDEEDEDEEFDSDMEMGMEGEESTDMFEDYMDELKKRGLEASDEEKEEPSTDGSSAINEGESKDSDDEGKSAGDESAEDGEEASETKAGESNTEGSSENDNSFSGSGVGRGKPNFDEIGKGFEPKSHTDESFRARESELVVDDSKDITYNYGSLPIANLKNIIVDHKEIHKLIRDHYERNDSGTDEKQLDRATKTYTEFRSKNKKTVEYLAKEFEMKKAADAHSRTATANSGIIDTGMLHEYKYNEHIFKKINVTADGKNHGLVMVVDWSGSMGNNIKGTIEQMMVLVMFAKRVNIPFEVFLFSDSYPSEIRNTESSRGMVDWTHKDGGKNGDLIINAHNLLNVFSSRMRASELHTAYVNMSAIAKSYDFDGYGYYRGYRTCPSELRLGGTPLNDSLLAINTFIPEFKLKNGVQVVNLIYLTDGDSSGGEAIWDRRVEMKEDREGKLYESHSEYKSLTSWSWSDSKAKVIIRDPITKKEYQREDNRRYRFSRNTMTNLYVKILRDKHNLNVVNFFITPKLKRYDAADFIEKGSDISADQIIAGWRKDGHIVAKSYGGWSEMYMIKGGQALGVQDAEFEVKEEAKKGEIKRAFAKFNKGKLKNRLLLSKFVDMVAA